MKAIKNPFSPKKRVAKKLEKKVAAEAAAEKLEKNLASELASDAVKTQGEEYLVDEYGRPINVMIPTAEVEEEFVPRDEDEAAVYKHLGMEGVIKLREMKGAVREDRNRIARDTMSAGIEGLTYLPYIGEAIDLSEIVNAYETGEDLSGEEVDPNVLAATAVAAALIPNIIEKPVRSGFRAIKKLIRK